MQLSGGFKDSIKLMVYISNHEGPQKTLRLGITVFAKKEFEFVLITKVLVSNSPTAQNFNFRVNFKYCTPFQILS